jgi:prophage antirepressor-like protein
LPKQTAKNHRRSLQLLDFAKGQRIVSIDFKPYGVTSIPLPDAYRLIMRSKLSSAEKFENWVISEILPCIQLFLATRRGDGRLVT